MDAGFYSTREILRARLAEPAPARIQMLTGPRQVGKTTILLEIAREWGAHALYLAGDEPEAAFPGWWLSRWGRAVEMAQTGTGVLLIDEVQSIPDWARLVKAAIDQVYREQLPLHLVISGSAALPLAGGARERLAGRFEHLTLRHWTARDLVRAFGLGEDAAAERYVRYGAFPGSFRVLDDLSRWKAYIREAIIDAAIGRDLLMLEQIRRPALLRQVFALAIGHPGEIVSLQKIAGSLTESGALDTIAHYLEVLGEAYLITALPKFAATALRRRAAPPKLIPLSNALLAVAGDEQPPEVTTDPRRWGRWLENACLARAVNAGYRVSYWREEPYEVDMILSGEDGRWAVEIKSGEFTAYDLTGVLEFHRRNPEYRPLLIGRQRYRPVAENAGLAFIRWEDFVLDGLAGVR